MGIPNDTDRLRDLVPDYAERMEACARAFMDVRAIIAADPQRRLLETTFGLLIARPDDVFPWMSEALAAVLPFSYTGPLLVIAGAEPRGLPFDRKHFALVLSAMGSDKFAALASSDPPLGHVWALFRQPILHQSSCLIALSRQILEG